MRARGGARSDVLGAVRGALARASRLFASEPRAARLRPHPPRSTDSLARILTSSESARLTVIVLR